MADDGPLVEGLHPQAKVIHVAARALAFDEIDHRRAHAQVRHAELGAVCDMGRAEHLAVEAFHDVDVPDAQHDVVDSANLKHFRYRFCTNRADARTALACRAYTPLATRVRRAPTWLRHRRTFRTSSSPRRKSWHAKRTVPRIPSAISPARCARRYAAPAATSARRTWPNGRPTGSSACRPRCAATT